MKQFNIPHTKQSDFYNSRNNPEKSPLPMALDDQLSVKNNSQILMSESNTIENIPQNQQLKTSIFPKNNSQVSLKKVEIISLKKSEVFIDNLREETKPDAYKINENLAMTKEIFCIESKKIQIETFYIFKLIILFIFIEYFLILTAQLFSYYFLESIIGESTYITGIVLASVYVILAINLMIFADKKNIIYLKIFEFLVYLVLLSWAMSYLDFSFLSLSYMILYTMLLFIISVK